VLHGDPDWQALIALLETMEQQDGTLFPGGKGRMAAAPWPVAWVKIEAGARV
jgi:hypothetical protein